MDDRARTQARQQARQQEQARVLTQRINATAFALDACEP